MNKFSVFCRLKRPSTSLRLLLLLASVSLTACGGGGGSGSSTASAASSKPPTASSSALLTTEDTPVNQNLAASDPEGDPLTYRIINDGSLGSAVITNPSTGAFTYTPAPNTNGTDNFTFRVNDGTSDSNSATVTVTITAVNDAPVAQTASLGTSEDVPLNNTLTASDPDGTPLTYSLVSDGTLGNVVITNATTGAFTYTPLPNNFGTDSFTFKAHDNVQDSNIATVTITISPVNDAPIALAASLTTNEDVPLNATLTASDLDSGTLTYSLVSNGTLGNVVITNATTGAFTYTPLLNSNGTDSFTFKVNDGALDSNVATVTVTVNPVNDAPVAQAASLTTNEDIPLNGTLTASDTDSSSLTYSLVSDGTLGNVVITNASTGAFTYTPLLNSNGTDSFTFKANDGGLDSNVATVTVTVNPVNDAPVAQAASLTTNENVSLNSTLVASDPDSSSLTYSLVSDGTLGNVVITNASTGAFTYTPLVNSFGSDSFTFKVNDGVLDSNTATVTISINAAPTASGSCGNTPQPATNGASLYSAILAATDPDSDPLLYRLPSGSTDTFLITAKGGEVNITDPTTGAYTYKPKALADGGDRGLDSFSFQVIDPSGSTSTATEKVIVNQTIMPLGDSITVGDTDVPTSTATTVGYRLPLNDNLISAGIGFDLVGTQAHGTAVSGFDFDHEGHGGWTANEIAFGGGTGSVAGDGVYGWLSSNPSDFILLHAGTNSLAPGNDVDIQSILNEVDRWELDNGKNVTVLLALIIDQVPNNPDVTAFNQNVLAMANTRITNGDDIIIVDQQNSAGLVYTVGVDMSGSLHPNASGYAKMANAWLGQLTTVIDQCP